MDPDDRRARFEALFAAHAPTVLAYARRRTDRTTADDVLSEVFAVAWRRLDQVPPDPLPWLPACARHVLAHARRGQHRRAALIRRLATTSPPAEAWTELADGALARALASLSERDREVLLLVAWDGLAGAQAASVLGCSRRAFSMRLHRARRRLSEALARDRSEPLPTMEACSD